MCKWVLLSSMTTSRLASKVWSKSPNKSRSTSSRSTAPSVFFSRLADALQSPTHRRRADVHSSRALPFCYVRLQCRIIQPRHLRRQLGFIRAPYLRLFTPLHPWRDIACQRFLPYIAFHSAHTHLKRLR